MGLLTALIAAPLAAPLRGVVSLARIVAERVEAELYDEDKVRRELAELQLRFDLGELGEVEFAEAEDALLARLREIRKAKKEREANR